MSALTLATAGLKALQDKDYPTAISKLTAAIQDSASPKWLAARSKALIATGAFDAALTDAELAYHIASDRGSRDLMIEAVSRRAAALYRLGKYADADACWALVMDASSGGQLRDGDRFFENVDKEGRYAVTVEDVSALMKRGPNEDDEVQSKEKVLANMTARPSTAWRSAVQMRYMCLNELARKGPDHPGQKITVKRVPPRPAAPAKLDLDQGKVEDLKGKAEDELEASSPAAAANANPPVVKKERIPTVTFNHYEDQQAMRIEIYAKGVDKSKFKMTWVSPSLINVEPIPGTGTESGIVTFVLSDNGVEAESTHTITPYKVNLKIVKAAPGKWDRPGMIIPKDSATGLDGTLSESSGVSSPMPARSDCATAGSTTAGSTTPTSTQPNTPAPAPTRLSNRAAIAQAQAQAQANVAADRPKETAPAYPTSSRGGPRDWDSILKDEDDDEETAGGAGDPDAWFKKLYAGATPEQQRAMIKSFTESNGTALSTDWDDVSKRTVETKPPEGVEAKKWGKE